VATVESAWRGGSGAEPVSWPAALIPPFPLLPAFLQLPPSLLLPSFPRRRESRDTG